MNSLKVGIVGTGRAGVFFGRRIKAAGHRLTVIRDVSAEQLKRARRELVGEKPISTDPASFQICDLIMLTVPDDCIQKACSNLAEHGYIKPGAVVIHTSGATSLEVLNAAKLHGAFRGSIHPMLSLSAASLETRKGTSPIFAVNGDPDILPMLIAVSEQLSTSVHIIGDNQRTRYHLASVFAANFVGLLHFLARDLLKSCDIAPEAIDDGLLQLELSALRNLTTAEPPLSGLTGPVMRGDCGTVRKHIQELQRSKPRFESTYRILSRAIVDLASEQGMLSAIQRRNLLEVLDEA